MTATDDYSGTFYFNGEPLGKVTADGVPLTVHADELKVVTKKPDDKYRETHIEYTESLGDAYKSIAVETFLTADELLGFVREVMGA